MCSRLAPYNNRAFRERPMRLRNAWSGTAPVALLFVLSSISYGQAPFFGNLNPVGSNPGGLRLYGVYGYTSYSSSPLLFGNVGSTAQVGQTFGQSYDLMSGGGASIGWNSPGPNPRFGFTYSAGYSRFQRNSDLSFLSQNLEFHIGGNKGYSKKLSSRWTVGMSGTANATNAQAFLFSPNALSRVAQVPATFDDLANGIVTGTSPNPDLASLLTGGPVLESPAQLLLYGSRFLTASVTASATYQRSPRLAISVNVGATRIQTLPGTNPNYLVGILGHSTSGSAGVSASYSLSPRTEVGFGAYTSRTFSKVLDAYNTSASGSLGRIMGRHWFLRVGGGAGFITASRGIYSPPAGLQYTAVGALGFKTRSQTFLVSAERAIADQYSYGAASSTRATGAWTWSRPGTRWSVFASGGQTRMQGGFLGTVDSWRASAGMSRMLSRTVGANLMYSYLANATQYAASPYNQDASGVMLMIYWSPGALRR
jgi:hypothetical protein